MAADASGIGRWRGPSVYDAPFVPNMDAVPGPPMAGRISPRRASSSSMDASAANYPTPDPTAHPFTLFTTTDFKILRASPSCFSLVGYHPNEFVNLNLLDWIHPQDRHLIDMERNRLLAVPYIEGQLRSVEVTQATITQKTELELLSPAEGMREPYPNKNVRVLHADNRFSPFNVRLHLGGGLGASLWQPVTLGRVYLVVSFLAIPRSHHFPPDVAPVRRVSQINPPTPITSAPAMPGQGLPGFSSIAAGVDGPQPRYDQPPPQVYYPPPQQPPTARPPPPLTAQPYPSYHKPPCRPMRPCTPFDGRLRPTLRIVHRKQRVIPLALQSIKCRLDFTSLLDHRLLDHLRLLLVRSTDDRVMRSGEWRSKLVHLHLYPLLEITRRSPVDLQTME